MSDITIPTVESAVESIAEPTIQEPETPIAPVTEPEPEINPEDEPHREPVNDPVPGPVPGPDSGPEPSQAPVSEPESESGTGAAAKEETPAAAATERLQHVKQGIQVEPPPVEVETQSFGEIFSEFNRTNTRRDGSSQIRGTVVSVTADSVLVDIGFKTEGILPLSAFPVSRETGKPGVQVGDSLQVSVKGRDQDGYYELSLFKTAQPKDWSSLQKAFDEKSTIVGTVTAVVKGGLHVDIGVKAFLPASRSGARDASEMEKLIGEEIRCRITKLDVEEEDVVIDRRVVTEEEALEAKGRRFAEVTEGAVVNGTVRSLAEYGAFIDLGGVDGLLHISDMAWSRVASVSDVLTIGQQIEVKVLKIDPEIRRIALGLKQLQPHPWDTVPEKFKLGDRVKGVVTRTADFGAFVELEPGVEGLVHLSEMSYTKRILKATEVVKVGDVVDAVILSIALPERRISLGLKQALGDPWVEAAARLTPGSIIEGPVASITKFGAFVTVADGVQGLVHISEIVPDRRLNHPSDVLHTGQIVRALVLEIDKEKRQLKLSMKQLIPTGLDEFLTEHKVGDQVTGRVVSVADGVAQIELGEGILVPCTLPKAAPIEEIPAQAPDSTADSAKVDLSAFSSMLKNKWKAGSPAGERAAKADKAQAGQVAAGQVRSFRITELDAQQKSIHIELS